MKLREHERAMIFMLGLVLSILLIGLVGRLIESALPPRPQHHIGDTNKIAVPDISTDQQINGNLRD